MLLSDALRLIAGRSPKALPEALGAIKAQRLNSPMAARRADRAIALALADDDATWSPLERAALAALLSVEPDTTGRSTELRLRVTPEEKQRVQEAAQEARLSVSDFIRSRIGLA